MLAFSGLAAGTAALGVGAVVVGRVLRSPEQRAADAAPPAASVITVAVERRLLAEPIVLRGYVRSGASVRLHPAASATGPDSVITQVFVKVGQELDEGNLIAMRSGLPLIALAFAFPPYRDLVGGDEGDDVAELQKVLRRLGYGSPRTARLDAGTQAALGDFYSARGVHAPPGSPDAAERLPAAQADLAKAQQAYDAAVAAQSGIDEAAAQLAQAKATQTKLAVAAGPALPRTVVVPIDRPGRRVTAVPVAVGTVLSDKDSPLVELDGEPPYVIASATPEQAALLHRGQPASLADDGTGHTVALTITQVGTASLVPAVSPSRSADSVAPTDKAQTDGIAVQLAAAPGPLPAPSENSIRVDIAADASAGPVLAVPVTAIFSRPDRSKFVTVVNGDTTADVTVTAGVIAGGWVEISPSDPAALREGSRVVVGYGPATQLK